MSGKNGYSRLKARHEELQAKFNALAEDHASLQKHYDEQVHSTNLLNENMIRVEKQAKDQKEQYEQRIKNIREHIDNLHDREAWLYAHAPMIIRWYYRRLFKL